MLSAVQIAVIIFSILVVIVIIVFFATKSENSGKQEESFRSSLKSDITLSSLPFKLKEVEGGNYLMLSQGRQFGCRTNNYIMSGNPSMFRFRNIDGWKCRLEVLVESGGQSRNWIEISIEHCNPNNDPGSSFEFLTILN